jgi:hypothetical protein
MVRVLSRSKARERSEVYAPLEAAPMFGLGYSHPPPQGPKPIVESAKSKDPQMAQLRVTFVTRRLIRSARTILRYKLSSLQHLCTQTSQNTHHNPQQWQRESSRSAARNLLVVPLYDPAIGLCSERPSHSQILTEAAATLHGTRV